jgi:NADPH2:quinone reductase
MGDVMRAVVVTEPGGTDVLEVQERPIPGPGAGQLLVEVAASGVNFIDVYKRQGVYPMQTPFVLGEEFAGRVVQTGEGVDDFAIGDAVAAASVLGSHSTHIVVDTAQAVPVPDDVALDIAAAAMLQGMTAHYLVHSTYQLHAGETTLVHAAAGGVGQLLVQLAKAKGARVIATVGSAAKVAIARERGADEVLRYDGNDDLAEAIRAVAPNGVDVAYDGVGRATFDASLAALRTRGMLVLYGASSGQVPPFDIQRLNRGGSLYLTRPTLGHYVGDRDELLWRAHDVFAAIADGTLQVQVGGRYGLSEAARAYDDLEARRTTGKLLIVPEKS